MARKLASVQRILSTESIEGADRIEIARVLGWQCVTQKSNNFKPGDLVCYFEVDSLLPLDIPQFAFLRKKDDQTEARIKTIKLKGKFAQGLILPLATIDEILGNKQITRPLHYTEDEDLTDALGIKKWEPDVPAQLAGTVVGQFPTFVSKTDETRIQSCPQILERYKGVKFYAAEKIDGSSITTFLVPRNAPGLPPKYLEDSQDEMIFGVCSRNLCIKRDPNNSFWKVVIALDLERKLREQGLPIVLQGELHGPGVQKNKLQLPELNIRWFNVVDPLNRVYYGYNPAQAMFTALGLTSVPILSTFTMNHTVDEMVAMSTGKSTLNPNVWREGIVVRPIATTEDRTLGNLSFKVINPEFSVKFDE